MSQPDDVSRRVRVGARLVAAGHTAELRLRLAARLVDRAALGARLRRVLWRHLDQFASTIRQLVAEHGGERAPAPVEDRAVEPALCRDVPARSFCRSLRAARHILDLQLLDRDHAVVLGDGERCPMQEVAPRVGGFHVKACDARLRLLPVGGAIALTRELALRVRQSSFDAPKERRRGVNGARRECGEDRDTAINADRRLCARCRIDDLGLPRHGDIPASATLRDRDVAQVATERAIAAQLDPANLRQLHRADLACDALEAEIGLVLEVEPVAVALALEAGERGASGEEILEGAVEVFECRLQRMNRRRSHPVDLGPQPGEFARLRLQRDRSALALPHHALFEREIVEHATRARRLSEECFLLWRRFKPIDVCALDDQVLVYPVGGRAYPALKDGACARLAPVIMALLGG